VTASWQQRRGTREAAQRPGGPARALSATDPDNPYEAVIVRGRVDEITHEGADEHIDAMAKKYLGRDRYPFRQSGEQRVKIYIEPEVAKGANE
jgi:hypothetical protein